ELEETIAKVQADVVLIATPIDLRRILKIDQPSTRVRYELQEIGTPTLADVLSKLQ
ncbi:MAG: GTPase, partial [bacterium]|nr:GTPase [bacterium]